MKQQIIDILVAYLAEHGVSDVLPQLTTPVYQGHGDYASNLALVLSKRFTRPPMEIAEEIKKYIEEHQKESSSRIVSRVDIALPGFLNIFLDEASVSNHVNRVLYTEEPVTTVQKQKTASKDPSLKLISHGWVAPTNSVQHMTVEFTDPNPFKEFHIGHLYSNAIGESLARLLASQGNVIRRVCYQGDVGMHVAKSVWGFKTVLSKEGSVKDALHELSSKPLLARMKVLGEAYAVGSRAYEEDPEAKTAIQRCNYLTFIAAQQMHEEQSNLTPQVDYKQYVTDLTAEELEEAQLLYTSGRSWSLEYFDTMYHRLGTWFDGYYFESVVGEMGIQIVRDHIADGVFEESDGAVIYRGEKKGLHTRVFINALGLPTYEAKELGLAPTKYKDSPYDLSVIVTAKEIDEYFKVLLSVMKDIFPELAAKTRHQSHGIVKLPEGKMSSRTGNVVTGESLLENIKQSIYKIIEKNKSNYTKEEQEQIAETAAIAAVKYSLLKVARPADMVFDIERSISFEGDSGPYLLYTYARCQSILRKAHTTAEALRDKEGKASTLTNEERDVSMKILQFPDVVAVAARDLSPNLICSAVIGLAQAYNTFYAHHQILASEQSEDIQSWRLQLTAATAMTIRNALFLLGIPVIERM